MCGFLFLFDFGFENESSAILKLVFENQKSDRKTWKKIWSTWFDNTDFLEDLRYVIRSENRATYVQKSETPKCPRQASERGIQLFRNYWILNWIDTTSSIQFNIQSILRVVFSYDFDLIDFEYWTDMNTITQSTSARQFSDFGFSFFFLIFFCFWRGVNNWTVLCTTGVCTVRTSHRLAGWQATCKDS